MCVDVVAVHWCLPTGWVDRGTTMRHDDLSRRDLAMATKFVGTWVHEDPGAGTTLCACVTTTRTVGEELRSWRGSARVPNASMQQP